MVYLVHFGISCWPASVLILNFSDHYQKHQGSQAWWHFSVIPVLGSPRQEDKGFEASLSYIVSSRPAWATKWHSVSKIKKSKRKKYVSTLTRECVWLWEWSECVGRGAAWEVLSQARPPQVNSDTQRGKGFWDGTIFLKKYLVSAQWIICHPLGCSVNQR